MPRKYLHIFLSTVFAVVLAQNCTFAAEPARIRVGVDPSIAENLSGRLFVFMTRDSKTLETINPDFMNPDAVWIAAAEISNLRAGKTIEVDLDAISFPKRFSEAPAGEYQLMALLDRDHSYSYDGTGAGDVVSAVVKMNLSGKLDELKLARIIPEKTAETSDLARIVELESPLLSAFWGRPVKLQAAVILPPNYNADAKRKYPTVYLVHGYGGSHLGQLRGAKFIQDAMRDGKIPEMIYVGLNAKHSLGHHVFADSVNNGPWGAALTGEFIPFLEKQFRMDAKTNGRFLTGHSSGGWATMWLMVNYPDVFGGTWSTSPDPLDFREFTGVDLTRSPPHNYFSKPDGKLINLVRTGGKELWTMRDFVRFEQVTGDFGGQMASFEAVFSPRGIDGQPMPLFDRDTGAIDPFVQKAWEKYDISLILRNRWKTLAPKLKGKIHIIVGTADTFHLDEAVRKFDEEMKKLGSDAKIEYVEGKDHFNLYRDGLNERIAREIYAVARPKAKTAGK